MTRRLVTIQPNLVADVTVVAHGAISVDRVGLLVGWAPPTNPKSLSGLEFGGGRCPPYGVESAVHRFRLMSRTMA